MGRLRKSPSEKLHKRVCVMLSSGQHEAISRHCSAHRIEVSAWAREILLQAANGSKASRGRGRGQAGQ